LLIISVLNEGLGWFSRLAV